MDIVVATAIAIGGTALVCFLIVMVINLNKEVILAQPEIVSEAKDTIDENTSQNIKIFKFKDAHNYPILSDTKKQINDYAEEHGWVSVPMNQDDEDFIVFYRKE